MFYLFFVSSLLNAWNMFYLNIRMFFVSSHFNDWNMFYLKHEVFYLFFVSSQLNDWNMEGLEGACVSNSSDMLRVSRMKNTPVCPEPEECDGDTLATASQICQELKWVISRVFFIHLRFSKWIFLKCPTNWKLYNIISDFKIMTLSWWHTNIISFKIKCEQVTLNSSY